MPEARSPNMTLPASNKVVTERAENCGRNVRAVFTWYQLVILTGATARLTRIVVADTITEPFRTALLFNRHQRSARRTGQPMPAATRPRVAALRIRLHELATCPWCTGFWMSIAVVALAWHYQHHPLTWLIAAALTISYLVGWLAGHE